MTEYNGVERTKTEPAKRLCELLDERDIEWHRSNGEHGMVIWERDGLTYSAANAWPRNDDTRTKLVLHVGYPTPEQAVAATVGVGTCKLVDNDSGPNMHCSACGGEVDDEYRYFMDSHGYSRCPHCGARIEATE